MLTDLPAEAKTSWRALLGYLLQDPARKERVVAEMGVNAVTLSRWVRGKHTPHAHSLYPLLHAFPEYRDLFLDLLAQAFPDVSFPQKASSDTSLPIQNEPWHEHIPLVLYEHVFAARATTPRIHLFWTVSNHVLRTMLEHLDAYQLGMAIVISQCLITREQQPRVLALRERIQFGSAPWKNDNAPLVLLGRESLAGYTAAKGVPVICQNVQQTHLPIRSDPYTMSMMACPLLLGGNALAGCLTVSSTQNDFFTPERIRVLEHYTHLLNLAFLDSEYFPLQALHLEEMPPTSLQQKHVAAVFHEYRDRFMKDQKFPSRVEEAEYLASLQLAQDFVALTRRASDTMS